MDGHFVPNLTIGPDVVAAVAKAHDASRVDVHLMVREPDHLIEAFVAAGATALGVHVEACTHLHRTLSADPRARRAPVRGAESRDARRERSSPVLPLVDQVLVMTVNPGFGGQSFIPETLPKIRQIRGLDRASRRDDRPGRRRRHRPADDRAVALHGARVFVMGNAFFKSGDYKQFVDGIRGAARHARSDPYGPLAQW